MTPVIMEDLYSSSRCPKNDSTQTYTGTHTHTHTHTHTRTHTHTDTHTLIHTHAHTDTTTLSYTRTHSGESTQYTCIVVTLTYSDKHRTTLYSCVEEDTLHRPYSVHHNFPLPHPSSPPPSSSPLSSAHLHHLSLFPHPHLSWWAFSPESVSSASGGEGVLVCR